MVSRNDAESSSSAALLSTVDVPAYGTRNPDDSVDSTSANGEAFDAVPRQKRNIGVITAVALIFNRMVGAGIYATPSLILRASGSVGMFLFMWMLAALVASAGMAVYVEFGTALPRSGGEKNYLEYVYRRPRLLVTCCYAMYSCLMGWSAATSVVFGEYVIHAFGGEISQWNTRIGGFMCLSAVTLFHIFLPSWALRIQNTLALTKIVTLILVVASGMLALIGWIPLKDKPRNFDNLWEGTITDPNAFVMGVYNAMWSFVGYSTAHYSLSETRNPVKTIKRAAPLATTLVTAMYFLINIAYLIVIPKDVIRNGGRVVAAHFFRALFGPAAERILSIIISLSALGNILSVSFGQSRVIQELGREGALPYSAMFASNLPYNTPFTALALQWVTCTIWMFAPPPGDAYNFVLNLHSYPYSLINIFVSGGLLWLYLSPSRRNDWNPPYRAGILVVIGFFLSNLFLAIVPIIPPTHGFAAYAHLPYWLHVAATFGIFTVGLGYWFIWVRLLPTHGGYKLVREELVQKDGISRFVLKQVPL